MKTQKTDAARFARLDRDARRRRDPAAPRARGRIRIQDGPQHARGASVPQASAGGVRAHRQGNRRAHDAQRLPQQPARRRQRPPVAGAQRRDRVLPARGSDPCVDPAARPPSTAWASPSTSYDKVWPAMDGDLGNYVRGQIAAKAGLVPMERIWDLGFRQITNSIEADQVRRRPGRHEAARARRARAGLAVQGARHSSGQHAVRRGLHLAADQGRRRPGKSDVDHRRRQVLRGAEVLLDHQPCLGRPLDLRSTGLPGTACPTTSRRSSRRPSTKARLPSATSSPS